MASYLCYLNKDASDLVTKLKSGYYPALHELKGAEIIRVDETNPQGLIKVMDIISAGAGQVVTGRGLQSVDGLVGIKTQTGGFSAMGIERFAHYKLTLCQEIEFNEDRQHVRAPNSIKLIPHTNVRGYQCGYILHTHGDTRALGYVTVFLFPDQRPLMRLKGSEKYMPIPALEKYLARGEPFTGASQLLLEAIINAKSKR